MKYTKRYKLPIKNLLNVKKTVHNKETGETAVTVSHTLTLLQPADNWQMSGLVGSLHTLLLLIYLLFLPIFILLFAQL